MKKISFLIFSFLLIFSSLSYRASALSNEDIYVRFHYGEDSLDEIDDFPEDAVIVVEGLFFPDKNTDTSKFEKPDLLAKLKEEGRSIVIKVTDGPIDNQIENYRKAFEYYAENKTTKKKNKTKLPTTTFVKGLEFEVTPSQEVNDYEDIIENPFLSNYTMYALVIAETKTSILDNVPLLTATDVLKRFDVVTFAPRFTPFSLTSATFDGAYKVLFERIKSNFSSTQVKLGVEFEFDYKHSGYSNGETGSVNVSTSAIPMVKDLVSQITISGEDVDYDDVESKI